MKPLPPYRTTLHIPLTNLFDTFSIDFAGPLPRTIRGNSYILVAVEHLSGWPVAIPTPDATSRTVINFVSHHIIHSFGPPEILISDNANCFDAESTKEFLAQHGIQWQPVLAYAPMSSGRAERMIGTIKRSLSKTAYRDRLRWDRELPSVLYGYRRRRLREGYPPFQLLYGVSPRMNGFEPRPLLHVATDADRSREILATDAARATRADIQNTPRDSSKIKERRFTVGDQALVAKGKSFLGKLPAFTSKFTGPCRAVKANHPRYHLTPPATVSLVWLCMQGASCPMHLVLLTWQPRFISSFSFIFCVICRHLREPKSLHLPFVASSFCCFHGPSLLSLLRHWSKNHGYLVGIPLYQQTCKK